MENKSYKESVIEEFRNSPMIIPLEDDPEIRGIAKDIEDFISQALDNQMKEVMEMIEKLKKSSEKFVPFQKIHYLSALEDLSSLIDKEK